MKLLFLTSLFFSFQAQAIRVSMDNTYILECSWQNSIDQYAPGYYRKAGFGLHFKDDVFYVFNDTYFIRRYEPCWTGGFSSCYFSFGDALYKPYVIDIYEPQFVSARKIGVYFDPVLELKFNKSFKDIKEGQTLRLSLSGDDNDGTFINDEQFICLKKKATQ